MHIQYIISKFCCNKCHMQFSKMRTVKLRNKSNNTCTLSNINISYFKSFMKDMQRHIFLRVTYCLKDNISYQDICLWISFPMWNEKFKDMEYKYLVNLNFLKKWIKSLKLLVRFVAKCRHTLHQSFSSNVLSFSLSIN